MVTFFDFSSGAKAPTQEVLSLLDGWAAEVLDLRDDALDLGEDPSREFRRLDYLFGCYKSRDRLSRVEGVNDLLLVQAIDALLTSFTEDVGRGWLDLTGMAKDASSGWWWERLPVAGPARDDFNQSDQDRPTRSP